MSSSAEEDVDGSGGGRADAVAGNIILSNDEVRCTDFYTR